MKRMSFSATVLPVVRRQKIVTRRDPETWDGLAKGDQLLAVDKVMGLKRGQKARKLAVIEIISNRVEPLGNIYYEVSGDGYRAGHRLEGFATIEDFQDAWARLGHPWNDHTDVRRIAFRYLDPIEIDDPELSTEIEQTCAAIRAEHEADRQARAAAIADHAHGKGDEPGGDE